MPFTPLTEAEKAVAVDLGMALLACKIFVFFPVYSHLDIDV